jgi:protein ImuA
MGSCQALAIPTGHSELDAELPNGGWPTSALIELLLQQHGIGELRLLRPALEHVSCQRRIALLQPPHVPHIAAWTGWNLPAEQVLWLKPERMSDALWAAEQILRNGSFGALLFWQSSMRAEWLRRLHLAAQASGTVLWLLRPLAEAAQSSPALLRLGLRPALGGIGIDIVKRRGPLREAPLYIPLPGMPVAPATSAPLDHAFMDWRAPALAIARSGTPALV